MVTVVSNRRSILEVHFDECNTQAMDSKKEFSKIWIRFEKKKQDGSVIKLRIQDLPENRMKEFMTFLTTYNKDEALHKAAGIYSNKEALEEYKKLLTKIYESGPRDIAICCLDTDEGEFDEILAVSAVHLTLHKISMNEVLEKMGVKFQTKELVAMFQTMNVMPVPQSFYDTYKTFYRGGGIIVHPEHRGLGICTQFVKQRRLMCRENQVPMTCAWMTSIGSQKAAERDGWQTVAEVTLEELSTLTGLDFGNDVPTYKLMMAHGDY